VPPPPSRLDVGRGREEGGGVPIREDPSDWANTLLLLLSANGRGRRRGRRAQLSPEISLLGKNCVVATTSALSPPLQPYLRVTNQNPPPAYFYSSPGGLLPPPPSSLIHFYYHQRACKMIIYQVLPLPGLAPLIKGSLLPWLPPSREIYIFNYNSNVTPPFPELECSF
jgi:hypothetical protein